MIKIKLLFTFILFSFIHGVNAQNNYYELINLSHSAYGESNINEGNLKLKQSRTELKLGYGFLFNNKIFYYIFLSFRSDEWWACHIVLYINIYFITRYH